MTLFGVVNRERRLLFRMILLRILPAGSMNWGIELKCVLPTKVTRKYGLMGGLSE
jgi:hypothetical protein